MQLAYEGINLQAPLPGLTAVTDLGQYFQGIYSYSIGLAAILAGIMITIGGLKWLTAAGNAASIGAAKKTIGGALLGMILVLSAYVILNTINPELVSLRLPAIRPVPRTELNMRLLGAANCTPGTLGCTCIDNDPDRPDACAQNLRCVATRFILASNEEAERFASIVGAGVGAVVARVPGALIGSTGGAILAVSQSGTLYKCTDGRDGSPCDDDEDCQSRQCQNYYHLCFRPPVEIGGMCNSNADCEAGTDCTGSGDLIVRAFEGTPKFCKGEGAEGEPCRNNNECGRGLTCLRPPDPNAFGRCREQTTLPEENSPCVLTADGGITPPACGEGNQFTCFYCPAAGEPGTSEGRFWTRLRQESPNAERRVGQCKGDPDMRFERCAN